MSNHTSLTVSVGDAAEILGVSRSTMYALVASKQVPSLRIGRTLKVPRQALHDMVAAVLAQHDAQTNDRVPEVPTYTRGRPRSGSSQRRRRVS